MFQGKRLEQTTTILPAGERLFHLKRRHAVLQDCHYTYGGEAEHRHKAFILSYGTS